MNENFPFFHESEKLANICIISRENAKITGIGRERDFTIQN